MVDGASYTTLGTFQRRKMAERDASRIAYFDLLQKLKNEAFCLIREDKSLYKSILAHFAAKMYMEKPAYETAHLNKLPVFSSSLVFGDVSCTGDICRSKKEAEQSVARAVILKYIDSESGIKLSEIIKSKYKQYTKMMGSQSVYNNANAVVQHGTLDGHSNSLETGPAHEVSTPAPTSDTSVPAVLAHAPLAGTLDCTNEVVQTGTVNGDINSLETGRTHEVSTSATPVPTVLAHAPLARTLNGTNEVMQTGTVFGRIKSEVLLPETINGHSNSLKTELNQEISILAGRIKSEVLLPETINGHSNSLKTEPNQEISIPALAPAIRVPTVLTQTPFETHSIPTSSIISAPSLGQVAIVPASHTSNLENSDTSPVMVNQFSMSSPAVAQTNSVGSTYGKKPNCETNVHTYTAIPTPFLGQVAIPVSNSSNVVKLDSSEASLLTLYPPPASSPAVVQMTAVGTTSSKKRRCKVERNSRKKTRADVESPIAAIPLNQIPQFFAQ